MLNKIKTKETIQKSILILTVSSILLMGIANTISYALTKSGQFGQYARIKTEAFYQDFFVMHQDNFAITVKRVEAEEKVYKYNEQVPVEVVKAEIIKQAKQYGNDEKFMINLADCESDFNNLADNPASTALGVYQFLIGTWEGTESYKEHKIARTDYIANIREANIKIANLEYSHWKECLDK